MWEKLKLKFDRPKNFFLFFPVKIFNPSVLITSKTLSNILKINVWRSSESIKNQFRWKWNFRTWTVVNRRLLAYVSLANLPHIIIFHYWVYVKTKAWLVHNSCLVLYKPLYCTTGLGNGEVVLILHLSSPHPQLAAF